MTKQKILIVDDTPANLIALEELLEDLGADIVKADNGNDAVKAAMNYDFDLILMDVQMPDMDGFESVNYIRKEEKNRHIPVIFQSAIYTDDFYKIKGIEAGAIDFITKPVSEQLLTGKVKILLGFQKQNSELSQTKKELQNKTTELEKAICSLRKMAFFDPLTELPNRRSFIQQLKLELARSRRDNLSLAVLFLDLEKFKGVNDTYGHETGDKLLKKITSLLNSEIREGDVLARLGGDEFIVFLHNVKELKNAEMVAAKINRIFDEPVEIDSLRLELSVSIGISMFPADGNTEEDLIKYSDIAMYEAKTRFRNSYVIFNRELSSKTNRKRLIEEELSSALKNREYQMLYQPIVDQEKNIYAVESLIRWNSPKRGVVSPIEFIPILENNRKIVNVTEWIIRQACMQSRQWVEKGFKPIITTINLSAYQFMDAGLIDFLKRVIDETQVSPEMLEIEITETVSMLDVKKSIEILHEMKKLNLKIAIDDFGTGFSSLSYLAQFPIDLVKIDKSFTDKITTDPQVLKIVLTIINLAKQLGLKIIAEGVEDPRQFDILTDNGCDFIQGYLISRPLEGDKVNPFLIKSGFSGI